MDKKALIIVDVQNDFCEGGALGVDHGTRVAGDISRLVALDAMKGRIRNFSLIVGTRDFHEADNSNGGHFAVPPADPDFVDTWPVHCVQGTEGVRYMDDFEFFSPTKYRGSHFSDHIDLHIVKGMGRPDYSGFQGVIHGTGVSMEEALKAAGITDIMVVGIATDHCVKATALDGLAAGFNVEVPDFLTAAVGNKYAALKEMKAAGATILFRNTAEWDLKYDTEDDDNE